MTKITIDVETKTADNTKVLEAYAAKVTDLNQHKKPEAHSSDEKGT